MRELFLVISLIAFSCNLNFAQSNFLDSLLGQPFKTGVEDIYPKPPLAMLESVRVKVRVCVNQFGEILDVEFVPKGSTTVDKSLIEIAIKNAREWKFNPSKKERQCGTIDYDFKSTKEFYP